MKKLLFTIVFLSIISFIGISKVNALPVGGDLDNWDTNKIFAGQFYADTGAKLEFYSYDGYSTGNWSCPYLDTGNANFGPSFCYNDPSSDYYNYSSFLINSYPFCTGYGCTEDVGSVRNLVIKLKDNDILQPNTDYHIEVDMGVKTEWFDHLRELLKGAFNIQNSQGVIKNKDVVCYNSGAIITNNPYGRNYCKFSFDYTPSSQLDVVFLDLNSNSSLAEFNYNIEWLLYPKISLSMQNIMDNYNKYTLNANEKAFISGITEGSIYYQTNYYFRNKPYAMYFDKEVKAQNSYNWLNYPKFTYDGEYFYDEFQITEPNDLIMISTEKWNDIAGGYPHSNLEFYAPKNAFVDIIVPQYIDGGMLQNFKYKDPNTGSINNIIHNTSYFPDFEDENVNKIFQTIFNTENNNEFLNNFSEYWEKFKDSKIKSYLLLICFGGLGIYIVRALSR